MCHNYASIDNKVQSGQIKQMQNYELLFIFSGPLHVNSAFLTEHEPVIHVNYCLCFLGRTVCSCEPDLQNAILIEALVEGDQVLEIEVIMCLFLWYGSYFV